AHEKTPAFNFPNKVDLVDIKKRSLGLRRLSKKMENDYRKKILKNHKSFQLLIENIVKGKIRAKSEFYFDFNIILSDFLKHYPNLSLSDNPKLIGSLIDYSFQK
ncbi:MAG: hypothetical protein PHX04_06800, partial [Bacilli bacterium]|nr:hypothetical protein [Bacilli bacterium]